MRVDILTIFPEIIESYFQHSLMARAQEKKLIDVRAHDLRDWADDKHSTVDDKPYGGGVGMIMKVNVVARALDALENSKFEYRNSKQKSKSPAQTFQKKFQSGEQIPNDKQIPNSKSENDKTKNRTKIILMTPQGEKFTQKRAKQLSADYDRLIIISGRYEGYDERIRELVDEEISVGDYVLTGGELPALVVTDAVARLAPGVVGKEESLESESFNDNLLDYPQYTRPAEFEGMKVPEVLQSGDHEKIEKWRKEQAEKRTRERRPDLLE